MALRSRSRTTNPTSGPGRRPGSDGRLRHRRHPARGRVDDRHTPAEDLRRRAELLFGERAVRRRELGTGPLGVRGGGDAGGIGDIGDTGETGGGAARAAADGPEAGDWRAGVRAGPETEDWRARVGLALRERMPVWVQARCGLEPRSVLALAVVVVAVAAFAVQHFWSGGAQPVRAPEVVRAAGAHAGGERSGPGEGAGAGGASGASGVVGARGTAGVAGGANAGAGVGMGVGVGAASGEIVVDVSGKVRKPGIHRLPAGSRVVDALNAAGGVRPGTDTDGLNRARFLVDGEQVVVGGPAGGGGTAGGPAVGGAAGSGGGPGGGAAGTAPGAPVSLNTATVEQLDALPGVGPVLARHIVDYRTQQGGFRSVDELREVNGIGERRFADLRNLVRP
ncbi:helix-hairpin-helix domain-containing protein [Streptomyces sp. NPDC002328]|uniref:helix-hairpin-helix domain-containing protein n=1 Tax=Streptomyces sp. NPDC002328 TaxID=3364642 RepID=UPI003694CF3A